MQYAHTHLNEYSVPGTLVITGLTKDHLKQMLEIHANQLLILAGLSIVSNLDQFNKSIGREKANKRTAPVVAEFKRLYMEGTKIFYEFIATLVVGYQTYKVHFTITTVFESQLVKLIGATIEYPQ